MIEEALVAGLAEVCPGVIAWPNLVPEGEGAPFIAYRQTDTNSVEGWSNHTNTDVFEIDVAYAAGLQAENYRQVKLMARKIVTGLSAGFEGGGVCVYTVKPGKFQDIIDNVDHMHWVRCSFTFVYDTPLQ